jgi:hypothetical protein
MQHVICALVQRSRHVKAWVAVLLQECFWAHAGQFLEALGHLQEQQQQQQQPQEQSCLHVSGLG